MPTLIADDIALVSKLLAVKRAQQVPHTVALQPQRKFQLVGGQGLKIIGSVEFGGAIDVAGASAFQMAEVGLGSHVLRALEHHVLEQVSETGEAGTFIGRSDVIPEIDRHQRQAMIFVEDYIEAVLEFNFLVFDLRQRDSRLLLRFGLLGRRCAGQRSEQKENRRILAETIQHEVISRKSHNSNRLANWTKESTAFAGE